MCLRNCDDFHCCFVPFWEKIIKSNHIWDGVTQIRGAIIVIFSGRGYCWVLFWMCNCRVGVGWKRKTALVLKQFNYLANTAFKREQ